MIGVEKKIFHLVAEREDNEEAEGGGERESERRRRSNKRRDTKKTRSLNAGVRGERHTGAHAQAHTRKRCGQET